MTRLVYKPSHHHMRQTHSLSLFLFFPLDEICAYFHFDSIHSLCSFLVEFPNFISLFLSLSEDSSFSSLYQILQRLESSPALGALSPFGFFDSIASPIWIWVLNRRSSRHGCRERPYHHEGGPDGMCLRHLLCHLSSINGSGSCSKLNQSVYGYLFFFFGILSFCSLVCDRVCMDLIC